MPEHRTLRRAGRPTRAGRRAAFGLLGLILTGVVALGGCTSDSEEPGGELELPHQSVDPDYQPPRGLLLAAPAPEGEEETNPTFQVLHDLIENTPAGERIRIVGNSFSYVPIAAELLAAHERGVRVQVILYGPANRGWQAPALLRDGLGHNRRADSFVQLTRGGVHQKVWSFTRTGAARDVVLTGSMNLTYQSAKQYTDMYAWTGRRDVRRMLDRRFRQLSRTLPDPPAYGPADLGTAQMWFYPGYSLQTDPVREMLAQVPPAGARIRLAMYALLEERGLGLVDLLADKVAQGAEVEIVLGPGVGPWVLDALGRSGITVHPGVFANGEDIHHKLAVVSYPGPDGAQERFVLTGSDNWTTESLGRPELLLRLDGSAGPASRRVWQRYDDWLDRLVARGRRES